MIFVDNLFQFWWIHFWKSPKCNAGVQGKPCTPDMISNISCVVAKRVRVCNPVAYVSGMAQLSSRWGGSLAGQPLAAGYGTTAATGSLAGLSPVALRAVTVRLTTDPDGRPVSVAALSCGIASANNLPSTSAARSR